MRFLLCQKSKHGYFDEIFSEFPKEKMSYSCGQHDKTKTRDFEMFTRPPEHVFMIFLKT